MLILNICFIFISCTLILYSVMVIIFGNSRPISRLEKYFHPNHENEDKERDELNKKVHPRKWLNHLGEKMESIVVIKRYVKSIQQELIKAGLPLKGEEFLALQSLIFLGSIFIGYNLTKSLFISFVLGLMAWFMPKLILNIKKTKRYKGFNEQLGDAIVLISNSLKAGHSFFQALNSVAREMPEPISVEFEKVLKEMRLGVSTEKALENLLSRIESDDLELMITAVIIQRQIGGNLSEILDNLSNTIRERVKLKGEIKTLTAQGKLSGFVISLLPIGLGLTLSVINPQYMSELFNNSIGLFIVGLAILNQIIGIILIRKIVKIEV